MDSTIQPKPTAKTTAFKVMLAAWLANILVIYLAKRGVFIPDELKGGVSEIVAEALNTGIPLITTAAASWLTKIVVRMSADKSVEKTKAVAALVQMQAMNQPNGVGREQS